MSKKPLSEAVVANFETVRKKLIRDENRKLHEQGTWKKP